LPGKEEEQEHSGCHHVSYNARTYIHGEL